MVQTDNTPDGAPAQAGSDPAVSGTREYGPRLVARVAVCTVGTLMALHTCIRIEMLNADAGHYLPRRDLPSPGQGNPKWRQSGSAALAKKAIEHEYRISTSIPPDQPLSGAQLAEIESRLDPVLRRNDARNRLRDLVGSWGLLQYLLAPACLLVAAATALSKSAGRLRWIAAASGTAALPCVVLMLYRGYFSSLGW